MAKSVVDDQVIELWEKRLCEECDEIDLYVLEALYCTDFGPIVHYLERQLQKCDLKTFEACIEKYFLWKW